MYKHYLFEDNSGMLHLAVLSDGACVYYLTTTNEAQMALCVAELITGSDPINDEWEGGEENPDAHYGEIINLVNERRGDVQELDEKHFLAYYITSFANGAVD